MRNYCHMMEQVTLSDRKKEEIMEMLENKDTRKRRMPKAGRLILAAALAVGCALSIAAGLPAQVYNFMSGGSVVFMPPSGIEGTIGGAEMVLGDENHTPIVQEDGKLWFVNGEERTDLTGLIDENTPYIYERTDPKTGNTGYVIMGGTVDNYGWAEFFLTEDGNCSMMGENAWEYMVPVGGEDIPMGELTEAQRDMLNEDGGTLTKTVNRPWLEKAIAQLDLEVALGIVD